jgi:hypothetical protein
MLAVALRWCCGGTSMRYVQSITSSSLSIESLSGDITGVLIGLGLDGVGWSVDWVAGTGCGIVAGCP